jgi:hypothetical protein
MEPARQCAPARRDVRVLNIMYPFSLRGTEPYVVTGSPWQRLATVLRACDLQRVPFGVADGARLRGVNALGKLAHLPFLCFCSDATDGSTSHFMMTRTSRLEEGRRLRHKGARPMQNCRLTCVGGQLGDEDRGSSHSSISSHLPLWQFSNYDCSRTT